MGRTTIVVMLAVFVATSCASAGGDAADDRTREERVVLVDFRHDEFASSFLRYYPASVQVHPGDAVRFKQTWTGEPHSITMGSIVDDLFSLPDEIYEYASPEEALAGGIPRDVVDTAAYTGTHLPGMTADQYDVYQPGAQPCFVPEGIDVPAFVDADTGAPDEGARCPTSADRPPAFIGNEPLYNSGFIAPNGSSPNTFVLPISERATPGTYRYFCNYHWIGMSGVVEIVEPDQEIASQAEVNRRARTEIAAHAEQPLRRIRAAARGDFGDLRAPLAGRAANDDSDDDPVIVNEFLPRVVTARIDQPVTWKVDGAPHTISFNVPKYFPSMRVEDDRRVVWDRRSFASVGWSFPDPIHRDEFDEHAGAGEGTRRSAGRWDGGSGFRSSGVLEPGDSFSLTFTRTGTFPFACLLHPQMVGVVQVRR